MGCSVMSQLPPVIDCPGSEDPHGIAGREKVGCTVDCVVVEPNRTGRESGPATVEPASPSINTGCPEVIPTESLTRREAVKLTSLASPAGSSAADAPARSVAEMKREDTADIPDGRGKWGSVAPVIETGEPFVEPRVARTTTASSAELSVYDISESEQKWTAPMEMGSEGRCGSDMGGVAALGR